MTTLKLIAAIASVGKAIKPQMMPNWLALRKHNVWEYQKKNVEKAPHIMYVKMTLRKTTKLCHASTKKENPLVCLTSTNITNIWGNITYFKCLDKY